MEKLKMHTRNLADENFSKLVELFPNAVTESINADGEVVRAIDKDVLMQEISVKVVEGREERYQFTWPDKKKSMLLANSPIAATLRPCREESVNFDTTENLYIEGDNLDVLKLLRETYLGKVKMIYIDPPYNTGKDFVYEDDFSEEAGSFLKRDEQYDEQGYRLTPNLDSNGRFHTDWLNMMYPRLKLAKDLLSDDGIIFISIDDYEVENLLNVCNEIMGESNMAGIIHRRKNRKPHNAGTTISLSYEFILVYYRNVKIKLGQEFAEMKSDDKGNYAIYPIIKADKKLRTYTIIAGTQCDVSEIKKGVYKAGRNENLNIEYLDNTDVFNGKTCNDIRLTARFCLTDENGKFSKAAADGNIFINSNGFPKEKRYRATSDVKVDNHHWDIDGGKNEDGDEEIKRLFGLKGQNFLFSYPKPVALVEKILTTIQEDDYIILDFFSGSATTAHAVMQLNAEDGGNRKFIMVQLPELTEETSEAYKAGYKNICEIGKERIRRAGAKIKAENPLTTTNLDTGFRVLKLDSSNMKDVYYNPSAYTPDLFDELTNNIKEDRASEDLLFQVMLELGIELSSKIVEKIVARKKVFNVAEGFLLACFDEAITDQVIIEIAKQKPYYFVMRDSSLADDSVAANFDQIFDTYSSKTIRKVL